MTPDRDTLIAWVKAQEASDRIMAEQCSGAGLSPNRHNELRVAYATRADHFAALHALLEGQGWQPIETAPKDTAVLIYNLRWQVGHFNTAENRWLGAERSGDLEQFPPTHWQPLPAPPAPSEAQ